MVNFFEAIYILLERHGAALREVAVHEANGKVGILNLQLARLRTVGEQKAHLEKNYLATLQTLEESDNGPYFLIFHAIELFPEAGMTIDEFSVQLRQQTDLFAKSRALISMDFSNIVADGSEAFAKDSIMQDCFEAYKDFYANEHFLQKVKETLDLLDTNSEGEKLTADQLHKIIKPDELKQLLNTMVQEAMQPLLEREPVNTHYMNMKQAAAYLKIKMSTLYQYTSKDTIPVHRPGRANLFIKSELDEWVAKR